VQQDDGAGLELPVIRFTIRWGSVMRVSSPRAVQPTTFRPRSRAARKMRGLDKPMGGRKHSAPTDGILNGRLRPLQFFAQMADGEKIRGVAVRVGMIFRRGALRAKIRATSSGWAATRFADAEECGLHLRFAKANPAKQSWISDRGRQSNVKATRRRSPLPRHRNGPKNFI